MLSSFWIDINADFSSGGNPPVIFQSDLYNIDTHYNEIKSLISG